MTDRRQHPVAEAEPPTATDRLRWDDNLTKAGQGRAILRSPLRLLMAAGAITMMIGTFLPWAQGHLGLLPVQFGGFDRASDGLILFVFGIVVLVVFVRSPDFLSAPEGVRRWAPLVLGLVCVGVWLVGLQQSELTIESWQRDYGNGSIAAGYWITGIGAVLVAITGAYATLRHHEGQTSDPIALFRRPRRTDAGPILTWVGGIAGLLVGIWAALAIFPPISVAAPMVFMGGVAGIVGAYLGRSIGNAIGGQRRSGVIGR